MSNENLTVDSVSCDSSSLDYLCKLYITSSLILFGIKVFKSVLLEDK